MKHLFLALFLMASVTGMAQKQLNDFKYIIVPKKFDGFKRQNQYQTSTLVKHLFTEKGFETAYEDDLPMELNANRCLGLTVGLVDDSSMFTTKTALMLKDCQGREILATQEGKSKEKDFKDSYNEAIREAFKSVQTLNYAYTGKTENSAPVTVSFANDVKDAKEPKNAKNMVEQQATVENQSFKDHTPKNSDFTKSEEKREMVKQMATREQQSYVDKTPKASNIKSSNSKDQLKISNAKPSSGVLYAQELENGYQLVDSTPKIVLKLKKTSVPDYYLAQGDDKSGTVFMNEGKWYFEYYAEGELVTEELDIKF